MRNPHRDIVVQKPWGYEYLIYETPEVALWLLYIEQGKGTSLHCHPKKTTGLILLEGEAELGFIADSKVRDFTPMYTFLYDNLDEFAHGHGGRYAGRSRNGEK
jgi:hypothetical protein